MKTQISRVSHAPEKRYSGVYQQQGRMITDADWNELVELLTERLRRSLGEVVGTGVPRQSRLGLLPRQGASGVRIAPGAVYVDGLRGELPGAAPLELFEQPDFPGAPAPRAATRLYVDLWERAVSWVEDPSLLDPGLHGADTTTRTQTMVQVKWCPAPLDPAAASRNPSVGDALFSARLWDGVSAGEAGDPCLTETVERPRIGNYLFRLEVHDVRRLDDDEVGEVVGGNEILLTLKWSSENGAEQEPLSWRDELGEGHQGFGRLPPEFTAGSWAFELGNGRTERHLGLHLVPGFTPARSQLTRGPLVDPPPTVGGAAASFVRRWDGTCQLRLRRDAPGSPWSAVPVVQGDGELVVGWDGSQQLSADLGGYGRAVVEGGTLTTNLEALVISLELAGHDFVPGDYWLAVVREEAEHVEGGGGIAAVDGRVQVANGGLPLGVRHHYLELGRTGETGLLLEDAYLPGGPEERRLDFPPLTALTAERVGYDPAGQSGRWGDVGEGQDPPVTVQAALDALLAGLDAGDVPWVVPECTSGRETVRERLGLVRGVTSTVEEALRQLMCLLDAGSLPYDREPGDAHTPGSVRDLLVKKTGDTMTGQLQIAPAAPAPDPALRVGGNCTVTGNLTVMGSTTTVDTATLQVRDNIVRVNTYPAQGTPLPVNGGLEVFRGGTAPPAQVVWDESDDRWKVGVEGDLHPIATGGTQEVVTGVITFRNLSSAATMVSPEIDPGLGAGPVCLMLALEVAYGDQFPGLLAVNQGTLYYWAEMTRATGRFRIFARAPAGGSHAVRWWALKPGELEQANAVSFDVTIAPASATLPPGATLQFQGAATGITDTALSWAVLEAGGGTVTPEGLYSAPTAGGTFHVRVASQADSSRWAAATVVVLEKAPDKAPVDKPVIDKPGDKAVPDKAVGDKADPDKVVGDKVGKDKEKDYDVVGGGLVGPGPGPVLAPGVAVGPAVNPQSLGRSFIQPEERPDLPPPSPAPGDVDG